MFTPSLTWKGRRNYKRKTVNPLNIFLEFPYSEIKFLNMLNILVEYSEVSLFLITCRTTDGRGKNLS